MNSLPPHDPLIALWQATPKPDGPQFLNHLQRLNLLHRRLNRSVYAIVCGIAILLIFEESTGRLVSHGLVSLIWILGSAIGIGWQRRTRCNRADALTLDTVSLLKFMIARAKSDLSIARWLYAGVPCGAAAGFAMAELAANSTAHGTRAVSPHLQMMQTGLGIAALIAMMMTGAILARSRRLQVQELSEKLKLIQADL